MYTETTNTLFSERLSKSAMSAIIFDDSGKSGDREEKVRSLINLHINLEMACQ